MKSSPSTAIQYQVCFFPSLLLPSTAHPYLPLPGAQPPSLLVTVSGAVTHGRGLLGNPATTPRSSIEGHPRVFAQTFILVPDPTAPPTKPGEVAKYYVGADALRFVG